LTSAQTRLIHFQIIIMLSGVRELALRSPGNLTIKVPSPALKRENMRSRMAKWCTDLSPQMR